MYIKNNNNNNNNMVYATAITNNKGSYSLSTAAPMVEAEHLDKTLTVNRKISFFFRMIFLASPRAKTAKQKQCFSWHWEVQKHWPQHQPIATQREFVRSLNNHNSAPNYPRRPPVSSYVFCKPCRKSNCT